MEQTVAQRIKLILDDKQISLNGLSKTLGMNQSTVLRQVKGEQTMSSNLVVAFLPSFPDVSAEWAMRGVGTMYLDGESMAEIAPMQTEPAREESLWQAKYEELEKRYDQLLDILGGGMRQNKASVG